MNKITPEQVEKTLRSTLMYTKSDVIQIIQQVLSSIRQSYEESVVEENFVSMSSKTLIKKFIQHFVLQIGKNEHKSKSGEQLYSDRDVLFVFIRTVNRIARMEYYERHEFQDKIMESLEYLDSRRR